MQSTVQPIPSERAKWVFSLQWFALVQGPRSPALNLLLQRNRPDYLCFSGHTFHSVGLYSEALPKHVEAYSAALCVAIAHPHKSWLFNLAVSHAQHWVVGVHEGAVISGTDRLYGSAQEAQAHFELLQQTYPHAERVKQVPGATEFHDWLRGLSRPNARLRPYRRRRWHWSVLSAVVASVGVWLGWGQSPTTPTLSAEQVQQAQAARSAFEQAHALNGVAGLRNALDVLENLPLQPGGWQLQHSLCQPLQSNWQCAVKYRRAGPESNNLTLEHALDSTVTLQFDNLDEATAFWRFEMNQQPLSRTLLQYRRRNERNLFSHLQFVQTAFNRLALSSAQVLQPPSSQGQEPSPDSDNSLFLQRRWFSQGPMRSHYMLLPWVGAFRWEQIRLQWHPNAQPSLQDSAFILTVEGYLYELVDQTVYPTQASFSYPLAWRDPIVEQWGRS